MPDELPWELRRRGVRDARRHDQRVREAIRENLRHLVTEEAIIGSDGQRLVRVPIRYLDRYHFRYGLPQSHQGVGQGKGEPGDRLVEPAAGGGAGQAGDAPGELTFETDLTVQELARMMLEDLDLPWLEPKGRQTRVHELRFDEVRRVGSLANVDKRRTLRENLKRRAARGEPRPGEFVQDDLRYRSWREEPRPRMQAAAYLLLDRSASMTLDKKYIAKAFFFWMVQFLRTRYEKVEIVFIAHDAEARLVDERTFFGIGSAGGTICSSAYRAALDHIRRHHPAGQWNNYVFHFSDGDNFPEDNAAAAQAVRELLAESRMVGYGEIVEAAGASFYGGLERDARGREGRARTLERPKSLFGRALARVDDPHFVAVAIHRREDVYAALRAFLLADHGGEGDAAGTAS
ncbi:MAG: DUF444 family protein [Bacillota bacterium]|nr:DUF444 family protein [Bacillota bacterium]